MEGKDGPQVFLRPAPGPFGNAVVSLKLPVRLNNTEVQITTQYRIDIIDAAGGRLNGGLYPVLGVFHVDHSADGAAGRVIDAGDTAGADGDECTCGCRPVRRQSKHCQQRYEKKSFHSASQA
jgi:hypothetical protein